MRRTTEVRATRAARAIGLALIVATVLLKEQKPLAIAAFVLAVLAYVAAYVLGSDRPPVDPADADPTAVPTVRELWTRMIRGERR